MNTEEDREERSPLKEALEQIAEFRNAPPTPANREMLKTLLTDFGHQLQTNAEDIPRDILEVLGPEDRRACLLAFCNLVAIGMLNQKPPPPKQGLIILPGRNR